MMLERVYNVCLVTRKEVAHKWGRRVLLAQHVTLREALAKVGRWRQTDTTAALVVALPFVREIGGTQLYPLSWY